MIWLLVLAPVVLVLMAQLLPGKAPVSEEEALRRLPSRPLPMPNWPPSDW